MSQRKALLMLFVFVVVSVFALQKLDFEMVKARAESPQTLKKSEDKIRAEMIVISRQLGVTCNTCHDVQNFKSEEKKDFKVAREHMKIVALLQEHGMNGRSSPEATCYMCHHGKLSPDFAEPLMNKK